MRRTGLAALLLLLGFALAGGAFGAVREDPTTSTTTTTTTTSSTSTTTTAPTTTVAPPPAQVLPAGIKIAGVPVGGMTPTAAFLALQDALPQTIELVVAERTLIVSRARLGAVDYLWNAIGKARTVAPGTNVQIATAVKGASVRTYVSELAQRFDRKPVDAVLHLRGLKPVLSKDRPGLRVQAGPAATALVAALKQHAARAVVPVKTLQPSVTRRGFGPVIVIRRSANRLTLFDGARVVRQFVVATGQQIYPTPLGRFQIVAMWKNPWWYPPNSAWAAGEKPVPPGPGNPLGTRWMGISSPGVGIHGTPDAASLGYSASHGCIRMAIPQAEWLFDHVQVGTPVYIVPS